MSISEKILEQIKKRGLTPKPRWQFMAKNYLAWSAAIIFIILGGLSFAASIYLLANNDWDIYPYLARSPLEHFLAILPYFWLVLIIIFLLLAIYDLKFTKTGYKYRTLPILGATVIISFIFGSLIHFIGYGQRLDVLLNNQVPYYSALTCHGSDVWRQPERGLLAGQIIKVQTPDNFSLQDLNGQVWLIDQSKAAQAVNFPAQPGLNIKIIGRYSGADKFQASEIRAWNDGTAGCGCSVKAKPSCGN